MYILRIAYCVFLMYLLIHSRNMSSRPADLYIKNTQRCTLSTKNVQYVPLPLPMCILRISNVLADTFVYRRGMHSVLDAVASLCVRAGKGEAYAVGLQFSEINSDASGKIILTIAGDGNVPVEVSSHLRALWMQLQEIAKVRYKHYKHQGMPCAITYSEDSPPSKNAFNGTSEILQRLKTDVFRHSLQKFVGRLDKRYDAFLEFSSSFPRVYRSTGCSNRKATKMLKSILKTPTWPSELSKRWFRRRRRMIASTF